MLTNPQTSSSSLRKSNSLNNLNTYAAEVESNNPKTDINQNQANRNSLLDKKKQQWNTDKENGENWVFGKPDDSKKRYSHLQDPEPILTTVDSNQPTKKKPPPAPVSKKYGEILDEYKKIKSTIEAITEAENKIKQEQYDEVIRLKPDLIRNLPPQPPPPPTSQHAISFYQDQSKVPAAMRTSIMFGVIFDFALFF